MSAPEIPAPSITHAKDVRAAAAAWLERHERGNWTTEDQQHFEAWLAQSMSHRTAYWRASDAWNCADRLKVLGTPLHPQRGHTRDNKSILPWVFRLAAASVVIAAGSAALFAYMTKPNVQTYATTLGGRETLTFADGSEIDLNTDTVLRSSVAQNHRQVWLDKGEAYFRIKHDPSHPFIVHASGQEIVDLGTRFIVRRDDDRLKVSLLEGRARVDSNTAPSETLNPGDVLVAAAGAMSVTKKSAQVLSDSLGWQRGLIVFRHTTLADAAEELNRYNARKLVIVDTTIARLTVVGTFRANDMASFVDVARTIFKLNAQHRDNQIILTH